jgi:hypothetical protein
MAFTGPPELDSLPEISGDSLEQTLHALVIETLSKA